MTFANNPAHAARNAPHVAPYKAVKSISMLEMSKHVRQRLPKLTTSSADLTNIIAAVSVALGRDIHFDGEAPAKPRHLGRPDW